MEHRIGLDFGTTATKIAYLDVQGQLQVFRYPHPTGTVSIPTALMYRTAEGQQSTTAPSLSFYIPDGEDTGTPAYEHFKVLLPLVSRAQWYTHGWPEDRSPQEVTRLYFRHLLLENLRSFMHEIGSIDRMVVAIPNAWFEPSGRSGRQILRRMFLQDLGLTNVQFHSDATCAVAYIAHCYQQNHHQALTGTILVCDMGGGGFQVALCRLRGKHIEMLAHDGDGEYGLGLAGVVFDRAAAATAYAAAHGTQPPHDGEFLTTARAFAAVKVREHDNLRQLLALQQKAPALSDTPLYILRDRYTLDVTQLRQSFAPTAAHIGTALTQLLARAAVHRWTIDYGVLLGGFSQFPLVQHAILAHLNDQVPVLPVDNLLPHGAERAAVVAYGAALLTRQHTHMTESYAHSIGIFAHRRERGHMVETFLPFVEAGTDPLAHAGPHFLCDTHKTPLTIHVAQRGRARLPLYVRWGGAGEPCAIALPEVEYPTPGAYHLALTFDPAQHASLLFKSVLSGRTTTCAIGPLRFDLLVEG